MICLKCDELTGMTSSGYRKCKLLLREIEDVRLEQDWCPKSAPERGEGMICENCGSPIRLDGPNKKDATLDRILERMEKLKFAHAGLSEAEDMVDICTNVVNEEMGGG